MLKGAADGEACDLLLNSKNNFYISFHFHGRKCEGWSGLVNTHTHTQMHAYLLI